MEPSSRYDPDTMGRIADIILDEIDEIDPESRLFEGQQVGSMALSSIGVVSVSNKRIREPEDSWWSRTTKSCAVGLLVVTVIVGLTFAIGKTAGKGGASISISASSEGAVQGGPKNFVDAPDDLALMCAPLTISSSDGYDTCKEHCSRGECCLLPEGHWFSCQKGNEEKCSAYKYSCETLDRAEQSHSGKNSPASNNSPTSSPENSGQGMEDMNPGDPLPDYGQDRYLPPPPSDIAQYCEESKTLMSNVDRCEEACMPAECCRFSSCDVVNQNMCDSYAQHCQQFWVDKNKIEEDLGQMGIGMADSKNDTTSGKDGEYIESGEPGDFLPDFGQIDSPPPLPEGIDQYCGDSKTPMSDAERCEEACLLAECCRYSGCDAVSASICDSYTEHCAQFWVDEEQIEHGH